MDESYWPPAASYLHAFVNSRHISQKFAKSGKLRITSSITERRRLIDLSGFTIKSTIDTFLCRNSSERRRGCSRSNKLGLSSSCSQMLPEHRERFRHHRSRNEAQSEHVSPKRNIRNIRGHKMVEAGLTAWAQADNLPTWTQIPLCFHWSEGCCLKSF